MRRAHEARRDENGACTGEGFDPSRLAPPIIDFYERTTEWRLDAWSQWSPAALPAGWLLSVLFARRQHRCAEHPGDVPAAEWLRADHALNLWSIPVLRFQYRLEREPLSSSASETEVSESDE